MEQQMYFVQLQHWSLKHLTSLEGSNVTISSVSVAVFHRSLELRMKSADDANAAIEELPTRKEGLQAQLLKPNDVVGM